MSSQLFGITRLPYFPELELLFEQDDFVIVQVLSALLYWHSRDPKNPFNSRQHLVQLSRSLRKDCLLLKKKLEILTKKGLLIKKDIAFKTNSNDPEKQIKYDVFYTVDLHAVSLALKAKGLNVPVKVLRLAADDSFDLWSYLSPRRLPVLQGLLGTIKGKEYDDAALAVAEIITGICKDKNYESFSYKALAPGWRMLVQPPATARDIVGRYLAPCERAIDVDLTDGAFFLPDGDYFGTAEHHIWHTTKQQEPRILAASLYLAVKGCSQDLHFFSDLNENELENAFKLVKDFTGLSPALDEYYYRYLDIDPKEKNAESFDDQTVKTQVK